MWQPQFQHCSTLNFQMGIRGIQSLAVLQIQGMPILAGLSRKSMVTKVLGNKTLDALNGSTVLNTIALLNGADMLRVHDVKEAVETVKLVEQLKKV